MTKSRFKKALDPPALDMGTEQTRKRLKPDPIVSAAQKWRKANMRDAPALEASAREIRRIYQMVASGQLVRATDLSETKTHGVHVNEVSPTAERSIYSVVKVNGATNGYICRLANNGSSVNPV